MKKLVIVIGLLILLCACSADETLRINNPWVRPGKKDGNSAAYFSIVNNTKQEDKLVGAETSSAGNCEIHMTSIDSDNMMRMTPQENIPIPAGSKVDFIPGGFHVMLLNLKNDLQTGEIIKITLKFEKAGKIEVDIPVKEAS
jgi:copper(I)-binding protein